METDSLGETWFLGVTDTVRREIEDAECCRGAVCEHARALLVCARVWECARARACMRVCAHTIPAFVFVFVCASVRLYEGASRLAGQRSTARRDP